MKFDMNMASVHAYLCADGYVVKNPATQTHKYYRIGFRNQNLSLLMDFQDKFEKVFGIKPRLIVHERCEIGSKKIYEELTNEFGSFYSAKWRMPRLNRGLTKMWLRAFFDCEGWVLCKSHQNRHIGLDSINKKGILQIKNALLDFKISSKLKSIKDRNINRLYVYGKNNLINFDEEISFLIQEKAKKLKEAIASYVDYKWDFNDFEKLFKNKAKSKKGQYVIRLISKLKENLSHMKKILKSEYNVESKIYKNANRYGSVYYELAIYGKQNINILKEKALLLGGVYGTKKNK